MQRAADKIFEPANADVAQVVYALDFSHWKRAIVRDFFVGSDVVFVDRPEQVPANCVLAVWGSRPLPAPIGVGAKVLRLEDGFLRSVGLGADLIRPISWVADAQGIYYDSTRPSDLEHLLATTTFAAELVDRARQLRKRIAATGMTKYNVGGARWTAPHCAQRIILVPGQVETDASIAFGAPDEKTNLGLLRRVREANPDAHLLYKPHPDVVAGMRAAGAGEDSAAKWCDEVVTDVPMGDLLCKVDEVHVLTSLAGFEALLRGRAVTCYGQPFYSGWGLTQDLIALPRRRRMLQIDELVAGVLILYPRYMSRRSGALISPEQALDELLEWRERAGSDVPWWRRAFRMVLRRVVGVR
jgi:capsular polysaccharide export protein